jgi:hypothetical protein
MAENDTVSVETEAPADVTETVEAPETTKAEIPAEVKRALQKANKEAETLRLKLKEFEDRDKTEAQKLQEERDALKAERDGLYLENLRREVADDKGLTPAQARRLVGTTREELEADADDVIATFPIKKAPVFGDVGQGSRGESAARVYTTQEINDHAFFSKHKEDILLAYKEGRIVTN